MSLPSKSFLIDIEPPAVYSVHAMRYLQIALVCLSASVVFAQQQQPAPIDWVTHTMLPVVVLTKSGEPVRGLPPDAFAVTKGVKGGKIQSVREVEPAEVNGKRPVTIMFDAIANPVEIQKRTRDGILIYLGNAARQNQPVNLLITTQNGARLMHAANTPPAVTLAALEKVDKATRALGGAFKSEVPDAEQKGAADAIDAEFGRLKDFEQKVETASFFRTLSVQFDTLQLLAQGMARVNGRKAVLWITSQFPVKVDEGQKLLGLSSIHASDANEWWVMTTEYEKTVRMLNAANVSLYTSQPVRIRALLNESDASMPVPTDVTVADLTFTGLNEIATLTGGAHVTFNTDIQKMIDPMLHDLGPYYIVDYSLPTPPERIDWKELGIKVAKDNVNLRRSDSLFLISTKHQNR
jgi:VWFA-related protein